VQRLKRKPNEQPVSADAEAAFCAKKWDLETFVPSAFTFSADKALEQQHSITTAIENLNSTNFPKSKCVLLSLNVHARPFEPVSALPVVNAFVNDSIEVSCKQFDCLFDLDLFENLLKTKPCIVSVPQALLTLLQSGVSLQRK